MRLAKNVLSDGEEGPSSGDLWDSVSAGLDPSGEGRGEGQRTQGESEAPTLRA